VLTWAPGTKVFVCTTATDMRRGFDTLAQQAREFLGEDPLAGHLFVFGSRRGDRLKVLYWDADGLALWYKRLEEGTFRLPAADPGAANASRVEVTADDLALILRGIDPAEVRRRPRYRRPDPS
jgi:transposase